MPSDSLKRPQVSSSSMISSLAGAFAVGAMMLTAMGCSGGAEGSADEAGETSATTESTSQAAGTFVKLNDTKDKAVHGPLFGYPHYWRGLIVLGVDNGVTKCLAMVKQSNGDWWAQVNTCPGDDISSAPPGSANARFAFYTLAGTYNGEVVSQIVPDIAYNTSTYQYSCLGSLNNSVALGNSVGLRDCNPAYTTWKTDNMWGAIRLVGGVAGGAELLKVSGTGLVLGKFGDGASTGPFAMVNNIKNVVSAPGWNNAVWDNRNPLEVRMQQKGCSYKTNAWNANGTWYASARCPTANLVSILSGQDGVDGGVRINSWAYGYRASVAPVDRTTQVGGYPKIAGSESIILFDPTDGTSSTLSTLNTSSLYSSDTNNLSVANNDGTYASGKPAAIDGPCRFGSYSGQYWDGMAKWTKPSFGTTLKCLAR